MVSFICKRLPHAFRAFREIVTPPEVPLAAAGAGTVVPDVAVDAGTVVPEAAVSVGMVEPSVVDAEGWVDAGIREDAVVPEVVPAKDEDGALDGVSRSDTRRVVVDAGKTNRNVRCMDGFLHKPLQLSSRLTNY